MSSFPSFSFSRTFLQYSLLLVVGYLVGYYVSSITIPKDIHTQNILTRIGDDIQEFYIQNGSFPPSLHCLSDSKDYGKDAWGKTIHYTLVDDNLAILTSGGKIIDGRIQYTLNLCVSSRGLKHEELQQ